MKNDIGFYIKNLPKLVGKCFGLPRGYGHAVYEIIGDHSAWKTERDAQKLYFHFDENGHPVMDGNRIFPSTICITIKRIGGFDGLPQKRFEDLIRESF